jgi:transposase
MAIAVQQMYPIAHVPLVLGVLRRLEVATVIDRLKALAVYAIPTPWLPQDTTTMALSGAYADEPKTVGAPRPAYGHSTDGRADLKQGLLSLGVSGAGGLPLRLGGRDGNRNDRVEPPLAIEECLALGVEGGRGIVADSTA